MWIWLLLISLLFLGGFLVTYKINRMSLIPSLMLSLFLISAVANLTIYLYGQAFDNGSLVARVLLVLLFLPLVLIGVFGLYALIFTLLMNARTVFKKESKSLSHGLTFILALGLIGYLIVTHFIPTIEVPGYVRPVTYAAYLLTLFYFIQMVHYLIATVICNLSRPKLNQHYIIVHGSGLINGKVPPLLAGRVDKAIEFYHKQKKENTPPKLILSGGQGSDESRPEAEAMAEYAYAKGIPKSDLMLEAASATTLQNMVFSKVIMDEHSEGKSYHCIYATSNYHLLRTGMYARMVGLKMAGIGSKTALYYLPNALIREYIAYVVMYKKRHLTLIAITFGCASILSVFFLINDVS